MVASGTVNDSPASSQPLSGSWRLYSICYNWNVSGRASLSWNEEDTEGAAEEKFYTVSLLDELFAGLPSSSRHCSCSVVDA